MANTLCKAVFLIKIRVPRRAEIGLWPNWFRLLPLAGPKLKRRLSLPRRPTRIGSTAPARPTRRCRCPRLPPLAAGPTVQKTARANEAHHRPVAVAEYRRLAAPPCASRDDQPVSREGTEDRCQRPPGALLQIRQRDPELDLVAARHDTACPPCWSLSPRITISPGSRSCDRVSRKSIAGTRNPLEVTPQTSFDSSAQLAFCRSEVQCEGLR